MRKTLAALGGTATLVASLGLSSTAFATDTNQPASWQQLPGELCEKIDSPGADGTGYTMPAEPAARDWSKLVIKKGSGANGAENQVFASPVAGSTYTWQATDPKKSGGWSHLILCSVPEPTTPTENPTTPTETPTTPTETPTTPTETPSTPTETPSTPTETPTTPVEAPTQTPTTPTTDGGGNNGGGNNGGTDVLGESATSNGNNGGNDNGADNTGADDNGGDNNGGDNTGADTQVLGEQATANNTSPAPQSAPSAAQQVPTVVNAGAADAAPSSPLASPAVLVLLGALMGLVALGMRRVRRGGGKA